jgi:hypothetical protein
MSGMGITCWSCAIAKIPCFLPAGDGSGRGKIKTLRAWTEEEEGTLDEETKSRRILRAVHLAGQTERPTWDRWTDVPPRLVDTPEGSLTIQGQPKLLAHGLARIKIIGPNPPLVAGPSRSGPAAPSRSNAPDPTMLSQSGSRTEAKQLGEELGEGGGGRDGGRGRRRG